MQKTINRGIPDKEIKSSLSAVEVKLCEFMTRVEFREKFGPRVALLLTLNIVIEIILKYRPGTSGTYTFSGPAASRPYRAPQVIKEVMAIIELKKPEAITCTSLRQQIATMSQVYEINDTQQDQLAQFLGHNIRVHRKFYRLPLDIVQKARVAKLLIAVNDGQSLPDANLEDLHIDADGKAFIDVLLWIKFSTGLSFISEI